MYNYLNTPDPYVQVRFDGSIGWTRTVGNEPVIFACGSADDTATLTIQIKHKSRWPRDPCAGTVTVSFRDLLARCSHGEASLDLSAPDSEGTTRTGRVVIQLKVIDAVEGAGISLDRMSEDVRNARSEGASDVTQSIDNSVARIIGQNDLYQAVGKLLSRIEVIGQVIDQLSEIHPFLTVAWKLLSGLYTAVKGVFNTDKRVIDLVDVIVDTFAFARDVRMIAVKAEGIQRCIVALMKQTIECCLFIRRYVSRTFFKRMLDTSSNEKIDEFERSFGSLKQAIESGVNLSTAFVSMRSSQRTDELVLRHRLKPMLSDTFNRPVCLPGTRVEVRNQIIDWIFSETRQNVFWLHGAAGSGKSTISMTIVEQLRDMSRLGAFLFFEREKSDPSTVIASIAYQLASFDPSIESAILSETNNDRDIITGTPSQQFDRLIRRPLLGTADSIPGPVVIALDAFDECGTSESRRNLMKLIREELTKLPNAFRFLITSRWEIDIANALSSQPESVLAMELDHTSTASHKDVATYLKVEIHEAVTEKMGNVIGSTVIPLKEWDGKVALLGEAAAGLFIWASTAIKMVKNDNFPLDVFKWLVSNSGSLRNLDELYATALRRSGINWESEISRESFQKIIALVLLSKIPLSSLAIDGILGLPEPRKSIPGILQYLRSVLTYSEEAPVKLCHASFADYFMSSNHSNEPWAFDIAEAKCLIVNRCFTVMKGLLRFNICDVKSSFIRNEDDPGLLQRIEARIPLHLEYACLYWSQHLIDVDRSADRVEKLSHFSRHQLLFWFEVLSLKKKFGRIAALLDVASYVDGRDADLSSFLRDASKLASIFAMPIMESVPHIYLSMIPLSKDESRVSAHYSKYLRSAVGIERRGVKRSAVCLKVLKHPEMVNSVTVSPDGRRIASASSDGIRVWDLHSGEEILCINHSDVNSVGFFPDGSRLVSGGRTVTVWNAENGDVVLGPLKGHTDYVIVGAVAVSPDGTMFASGSDDKTVIIWNASDGRILSRLTGHTHPVTSLSFSPDSSRLASSSNDQTVRIWNMNSRELALAPFEHRHFVESVAFSPDGSHVVSSSGSEVTIWDLEGNVISVLKGHTDIIMSVGYSPCGTRIVSGGGDDRTVIVWDAVTGKIVSGPFTHDHMIHCVTFSSDGEYIVSGSHETVRVWDATAGTVTPAKQERHTGGVQSVAFAADGSLIASADADGSIIIWDALSGDVAAGPLLGHLKSVECIAFTPDGSRLISCSWDGKMMIRDGSTGKPVLGSLDVYSEFIRCIAVSPDGTKVVTSSNDEPINVWDVATGVLIAGPLHGHSISVETLAYSPNCNLLASGSSGGGTVIIWDTDTWVATSEASKQHTSVQCVCFSPDSSLLASGSYDGTVLVQDVETRQVIHGPLKGHSCSVSAVVFLLDGLHVVSGSWDGTIRVWNVKSGQTTYVLEGHSQSDWSLAVSPDGTHLVSGSGDNTVRVWNVADLGIHGDSYSVSSCTEDVSNWELGDDGWIRGGRDRSNLLLWVPPDLRWTLLRPRNTLILSCEFSTKVNFTDAALGERWSECFREPKEG